MDASRRLEVADVFGDYMFATSSNGNYSVPVGWYPLLGLPGSLDIEEGALLFCKLQTSIATKIQKFCLNGVIEKIRVHRSARVNGPDTMRVFASDLIHEFEVFSVLKVADVEELISAINQAGNPMSPLARAVLDINNDLRASGRMVLESAESDSQEYQVVFPPNRRSAKKASK